MVCTLEDSAVDWVIEHPEVATELQDLRIDVSCGGKSLQYLCEQRGLDPQTVFERLRRCINEAGALPALDSRFELREE